MGRDRNSFKYFIQRHSKHFNWSISRVYDARLWGDNWSIESEKVKIHQLPAWMPIDGDNYEQTAGLDLICQKKFLSFCNARASFFAVLKIIFLLIELHFGIDKNWNFFAPSSLAIKQFLSKLTLILFSEWVSQKPHTKNFAKLFNLQCGDL